MNTEIPYSSGVTATISVFTFGIQVALGTGDKECSGQVEAIQPGVVEIATIHDMVSTTLRDDHVENGDVVHIASGDADKRRDVPRRSSRVCILTADLLE